MKVHINRDILRVDFIGFEFEDLWLSSYDSNGKEVLSLNISGYWRRWTYNSFGNITSSHSSTGNWFECTYDSSGNQLSYSDSSGELVTYLDFK